MRRRVPLLLKDKALASMRRAVKSFNDLDDDGRQSAVMLNMQHAFEMLLKGALADKKVRVFDKRSGRSIGFEKCLALATEYLALSEEQIGLLRAINALRDEEQHWLARLNEGLLYLHSRGAVTLFDEILDDAFDERLADHLPERVLPISTSPMSDMDVLVDEQYSQVKRLLRPGKRRRPEARALLRGLLAMEGHVSEEARVSERDVDRVEKAVRDGRSLDQVFPRLRDVTATFEGEGPTVKVHFTKREGAPVHFVPADDPSDSAAVREIDLQRKYHMAPSDLAEKLGLSPPRAVALRRSLGIDDEPDCVHVFTFGSQKHPRYSDNAYRRMREALDDGIDMTEVWRTHGPRRRRRSATRASSRASAA
ncbi:MAG TPA: hypothetical protein VF529_00185 [Solirubrobacteraceae bacterium]|jgi:hypothetical protein